MDARGPGIGAPSRKGSERNLIGWFQARCRRTPTNSQLSSQQQADTETSLGCSCLLEPASEIKILCMRITRYMECHRSLLACDLCAVFDHQPSNTVPSNVRLDKKRIQFGFSIPSRLYCRKTYRYTVQLRYEYPSCCKLCERNVDSIWIGKAAVNLQAASIPTGTPSAR
jgi:hypothetical protein